MVTTGVHRDNIIVFGRSLGGAVAIDLLASRGHEVACQ
jgi:pimeloyl-ACP methyl ester carboxylesterase